ncbi:MAG: GNAT family N-acetyltransferase [Alphaproteobacteria bacterium]|nr:GNAT family N-acetyltransferase [Alphaproteobacteria bacterium]
MLNKLAELHKLCFPDRPWSASDFADLKKSGCEIVASDNGFIVWRAVADEAEIISIGVAPDARRNGIAGALILIMEQELKKQSVHNVFLEVSEVNIPAKKLYEKYGFKPTGTRPKYYNGIDAIIMRKDIS